MVVPHPGAGLRNAQLGAVRPRATHARRPSPAAPPPRPRPERTRIGPRREFRPRSRPSHIVAVELLCMRYLWDDAEYLWLTQRAPDEDRFLSCNLNINWPDQVRPRRNSWRHDDQASILSSAARNLRPHDHHHAGRHVALARGRRPLRRLALLFQFRPGLEVGQHLARALKSPRARHAAVVSRPIHSAVLAVNPSRASPRIGGISSSGTNRLSASVPP